MRIIVGIDPGITGAVAAVVPGFAESALMPTTEGRDGKRIIDAAALSSWIVERNATEVVIEALWAMPKTIRKGTRSGFKLGMSYGACISAAQCAGINPTYVAPITWKKYHSLLRPVGTTTREKKAASRYMAAAQWPHASHQFRRVMDEARAEAALIALWGWTQ